MIDDDDALRRKSSGESKVNAQVLKAAIVAGSVELSVKFGRAHHAILKQTSERHEKREHIRPIEDKTLLKVRSSRVYAAAFVCVCAHYWACV